MPFEPSKQFKIREDVVVGVGTEGRSGGWSPETGWTVAVRGARCRWVVGGAAAVVDRARRCRDDGGRRSGLRSFRSRGARIAGVESELVSHRTERGRWARRSRRCVVASPEGAGRRSSELGASGEREMSGVFEMRERRKSCDLGVREEREKN
ncbi:ROP uanine nucleotide exchange factor 10 [Striga asiatica]|uniref:ROP uanine nucleotide exchange factor 10 n=1 Tax=Striga asiatica TaxID=4170 RepID=A0A5A7PYS9_STRAF|nr:ROP uanine nucleotide exchange factor 10 [Striga asiatica]